MRRSPRSAARGFTLVELAIALLVFAVLLGGLLVPLSAQVETRRRADAERLLADTREALMGFAAATGRLPCPATNASNGIEAPAGGGACTAAHNGFIPAVTLGMSPVDAQGFLIDPWGNRVRYALTNENTNAFSTTNSMRVARIENLVPDLRICAGAALITADQRCANPETTNVLSNSAAAVLISLGPNGARAPAGADETANQDNNRTFVSHTPTPAGGNEFDDIVVWIAPGLLYSRMIQAGQLP